MTLEIFSNLDDFMISCKTQESVNFNTRGFSLSSILSYFIQSGRVQEKLQNCFLVVKVSAFHWNLLAAHSLPVVPVHLAAFFVEETDLALGDALTCSSSAASEWPAAAAAMCTLCVFHRQREAKTWKSDSRSEDIRLVWVELLPVHVSILHQLRCCEACRKLHSNAEGIHGSTNTQKQGTASGNCCVCYTELKQIHRWAPLCKYDANLFFLTCISMGLNSITHSDSSEATYFFNPS